MVGTKEDFIKSIKEPLLINNTKNGKCSSCGECCTDLLHLDSNEIERIDKYMQTHKVKRHSKAKNDLTCPFRNNEKRICEIYEVRPEICQVFKCDTPPKEVFKKRDIVNANKKLRSMTELFFNDKSKKKFIKKTLDIETYRRGL